MAKDNHIIYFIDSNVFLRVLIKEDGKSFSDCYKLMSLIENKTISAVTSDLVLAEINWVLESYYKFAKAQVVSALEGIVSLKGLSIKSNSDSIQAIEFYKKHNVKFIDALIASDKIFNSNAIIVSYDRDFDKLGVKRIEPDEI